MAPRLRFALCAFALACSLGAAAIGGCAIVPAYQRETIADPAMDPEANALEARAFTKLHETRESAAGGDGRPAGGGCGCGN